MAWPSGEATDTEARIAHRAVSIRDCIPGQRCYGRREHIQLSESEQVIRPWIPMIALVCSRLEYGLEPIDT